MRNASRDQFIKQTLSGDYELQALAADASTRRYFRLFHHGGSMMVMDAPAPLDITPFVTVDRYLEKVGQTVPRILAQDRDLGFMLLEDFGDQTFNRALSNGRNERELYEMAMDCLISLKHAYSKEPLGELPSFDLDRYLDGVKTFPDWYMPDLGMAALSEEIYKDYLEAWTSVWDSLPEISPMIVLRDFHIDNLMLVSRDEGIETVGLLDFQDAVTGVAPYDILSLLEDARRDISSDLREAMLRRYFRALPDTDKDSFMAWYHALAAQRHIRVAGLFVRLYRRDEKPVYLRHIPRVISMLAKHLEQDQLRPVTSWLEKYCPDFKDISKLNSLKSHGLV